MIKKIVLWILVISCMVTIFCFSSQVATESKKTSSGLIIAVVSFFDFGNSLTETQMQQIKEDMTFIVRKGAHFSIYALLGILIYLLLDEYEISDKRLIFYSVLLAMLYACSDEFHQSFVNGRSGELRDVLIDTCGALLGCIAVRLIKKIRFRRNRNGLHQNLQPVEKL